MLNPLDATSEPHSRVSEIILKVSSMLTDDELHDLCLAAGIRLDLIVPRQTETRLQRLQRLEREFRESAMRG